MNRLIVSLGLLLMVNTVSAGQVEIISVKLTKQAPMWRVAITLRHADSGWDHYADGWRIVQSETNKVLGTKTLLPHAKEQPFSSAMKVNIPDNVKHIYVEARDNIHGWSKQRVNVNMQKSNGDRYTIQ